VRGGHQRSPKDNPGDEMRDSDWPELVPESKSAGQVSRAAGDYEGALGEGEGIKALEYIRLLEFQEHSGSSESLEITARWGETCEPATE